MFNLKKLSVTISFISVLFLFVASSFAQEVQTDYISDDKRPKTGSYYTYCMNKREIGINIYDLEAHPFVTDVSPETGLDVTIHPSCNFNKRIVEGDIRGIVIHYTNGSAEGSYSWWQNVYPGTSAHYIVKKDGTIIQSVPELYAASHLGCYWDKLNCLPCPKELCFPKGYFYDPLFTTIGIELENSGPLLLDDDGFRTVWDYSFGEDYYIYTGDDPKYRASEFYDNYTIPQMQSLMILIDDIKSRYGDDLIILGHSDIQQASNDPGPAFPWAMIYPEIMFQPNVEEPSEYLEPTPEIVKTPEIKPTKIVPTEAKPSEAEIIATIEAAEREKNGASN